MKTFWTLLIGGLLMSTTAIAEDNVRLTVGATAPDFTAPYATRDSIAETPLTLSAEVTKGPIVLAFYPADWSGGCTKEVCTFRDATADLRKLKARIWMISGDYVYSHHEWAKHHDLPFELLEDHDHAIGKLYHCYNPEYGKNSRSVYVIGTKGKIAFIKAPYSVRSDDDFEELKAALATL